MTYDFQLAIVRREQNKMPLPVRQGRPAMMKAEAKQSAPQNSRSAEMTAYLVQVAKHRDKAAFAELFAYFGPRLKSYLLRLGSPVDMADDLAQEAMVSVWRKADRFDPAKASASTWIFTVARNLRIDRLRRENRPELDPNDPALVPDQDKAADDQVSEDQRGQAIRDAMALLPEDQLTVVKMSFFDEKPHSEISEELGIPLGTVKSRLRLAFKKLRLEVGEGL